MGLYNADGAATHSIEVSIASVLTNISLSEGLGANASIFIRSVWDGKDLGKWKLDGNFIAEAVGVHETQVFRLSLS